MGTAREREKNESRDAVMEAAVPVDWMEVSNLGPAVPIRMRRTASCGIQAQLLPQLY